VEQEVSVTAGVIDSTHIYANALISNTGVSTEYSVNTLGIFASDGNSEVLFAVSTAETPDVIPVDSGGTPSTYKYKFNLAVSSTSDITISAVGNIDASDVDYDNSVSGLSATNVQGVIDEVVVEKASQRELSNLVLTGTTNTSGATIAAGTCFVLNGDFVTAKADIASGATFTLNTNYEKKSVGSILTELNSKTTLVQGTYNVDLTTLPCGTTGLAINASFLPSGINWGVFIVIGGRHKYDSSYKAILLITNSTRLYYRLGLSGGTWTDWVQTGVD
jgi:hypothetical protein